MYKEEFQKLIAECQPHKVFNNKWHSFYPIDFADTFLPRIKGWIGNQMRLYDGAELFKGFEKKDSQDLKSNTYQDQFSFIIFTYPKGVEAEKGKKSIQVGINDVCIFIETDINYKLDIIFRFGTNFRNKIQETIKSNIKSIENTSNHSDIFEIKNYFNNKLDYKKLNGFVFSVLGIESQIIDEKADRYDFLPVVKLNPNQIDKIQFTSALFSIESCEKSKKDILTLSNDFKKELREYTIPEIVIALKSKSLIPLRNYLGYDQSGFQDEDGVIEFKSSNSKLIIKTLNEDNPENVNNKTKVYDLEKAEIGDTYILEINPSLANPKRGDKFNIELIAKDDKDDTYSVSKKKVTCGKLNFKFAAIDVFMGEERQKVIDKNSDLVGNDSICFRVADKELAELFNNPKLVLESYFNENSYSRMKTYKPQGYIKEEKIFSQFIYKGGGNYEPTEFSKGNEKIFLNYFEKAINNRIGFHIFYFSLVKGYHVLTLIIDSTEPCNKKFQIYDQIRIREEDKLINIDKEMLRLTTVLWNSALEHTGVKYNTESAIWKLQRK